jgi:hypothetical protein
MSQDNPIPFYIVSPTTWSRAKRIGQYLHNFIFRGQSDHEWQLETSLRRAILQNNPGLQTSITHREKIILNKFKAQAHNYLQSPPSASDDIEWLSLVQDFGGPTRLLDFTESFYIAAFFALEDATSTSAIWCINNEFLNNKILGMGITNFEEFAGLCIKSQENRERIVIRVTPPRLNQRLAIQKGTFLFPCNPRYSFEENLCNSFDIPLSALSKENAENIDDSIKADKARNSFIIKILLSQELRPQAIEDLYSMNIDAASLFPDLSGFARSLKYQTRNYSNPQETELSDDDIDKTKWFIS